MVYGCYSRSCGLRLVSILCYLEDWLGEEKNPRTNQITVYVRELKALLFLLLSLHIEAFSRELKRKEALILVLEYLQPWMNWFYIHQNLWSWPKAWLALNYFGLIWRPWLVLSIFSFAFAHSSGVFQYSLPWKLIKEKKILAILPLSKCWKLGFMTSWLWTKLPLLLHMWNLFLLAKAFKEKKCLHLS